MDDNLIYDVDKISPSVLKLFNSVLLSQNQALIQANQMAFDQQQRSPVCAATSAVQKPATGIIQKPLTAVRTSVAIQLPVSTTQQADSVASIQQQLVVNDDQRPSTSVSQPINSTQDSDYFPNLYPYPREYKYPSSLNLSEEKKLQLAAQLDSILRPPKKTYDFDQFGARFLETPAQFKKRDDAMVVNAKAQIDSAKLKIDIESANANTGLSNKVSPLDSAGNSPISSSSIPDHHLPQMSSKLEAGDSTNYESEVDCNLNNHILNADCNIMAGNNINNTDETFANRSSTPVNAIMNQNLDSGYCFSLEEILHGSALNPFANALRSRTPSEGYKTQDSRLADFQAVLPPSANATCTANNLVNQTQQSQNTIQVINKTNRFDNTSQINFHEQQILGTHNSEAYTGAYYPKIMETAKKHRLAAQTASTEVPRIRSWSGTFVTRIHKNPVYSTKVFLGGVPWSISERQLATIFEKFGKIKIEWPGKEVKCTLGNSPARCGYLYIIFESSDAVKALINDCTTTVKDHVIKYYFSIKSRRIEVIPWVLADSNYVKNPSQRLDPKKTVFVGNLHGLTTAENLAKVMNETFHNVIYVGIDTDKAKYPRGSARVSFSNIDSYHSAVDAGFLLIKTNNKYKKKRVQIDPYLSNANCSNCQIVSGPLFCRSFACFKYYCVDCFYMIHNSNQNFIDHHPIVRNDRDPQSKMQQQLMQQQFIN